MSNYVPSCVCLRNNNNNDARDSAEALEAVHIRNDEITNANIDLKSEYLYINFVFVITNGRFTNSLERISNSEICLINSSSAISH